MPSTPLGKPQTIKHLQQLLGYVPSRLFRPAVCTSLNGPRVVRERRAEIPEISRGSPPGTWERTARSPIFPEEADFLAPRVRCPFGPPFRANGLLNGFEQPVETADGPPQKP